MGGGPCAVCELQGVVRIQSDVSSAAHVVAYSETFDGSKVEVAKGLVGTGVSTREVPHLNHVPHLLVIRGDLQAGRFGQHLLKPELIVDGFFWTKIGVGNQIVAALQEQVINGGEAVARCRTLGQDVVVGEENRLVADVE